MPNESDLQTLIEEASRRFAADLIDILREATVDDIMAVAAKAPAKRRGRPPKARAKAAPVAPEPVAKAVAPEPEPAKPVKKKRNWPKCSVEGCDANFYAPSGKKRMCYQHHIEAGGEASPLVRAQKKKAAAKPAQAKVAKAKAPAVEAEPTPVAVEPAPAPAQTKKKRAWPQCSAEGCTKNMWGPSGQAKLCYAHHREAGGEASPLLGKKKKTVKAEVPKAAEAVQPDSLLDPEPATTAEPPEPAPSPESAKPAKKKRAWPICTAEGCSKNVYMPSGDAKLCYAHHVEQGGKASPLVAHNRAKKKEPEPEPEPEKPAKKKTILRKKSES